MSPALSNRNRCGKIGRNGTDKERKSMKILENNPINWLILLPQIFIPILALGSARYRPHC